MLFSLKEICDRYKKVQEVFTLELRIWHVHQLVECILVHFQIAPCGFWMINNLRKLLKLC